MFFSIYPAGKKILQKGPLGAVVADSVVTSFRTRSWATSYVHVRRKEKTSLYLVRNVVLDSRDRLL